MPKYMFVFDASDNSFPERYRIVSAGEDADALRDAEELTGTILDIQAIDFLDGLLARCASAESTRAELVDAPDWKFVEARFNPAKADEYQSKRTPDILRDVSK